MKRRFFVRILATALPLALLTVFVFHPTHAESDDKSSPIEIRVDNFSFGPATLTVAVNSTVTWVNKDDVPHVISSTDGLFKSKALDTDDKYSYSFTKPGTYLYYCSIHPKMTGKIVVQ